MIKYLQKLFWAESPDLPVYPEMLQSRGLDRASVT
jgi:hypothetical protein